MQTVAVALGVTCLACFGLHRLVSVDLGYHLAYGRWMVQHGQVISQNQFSYSQPGWPFVNANWLFQLLVYGVYVVGGGAGLSLLLAGLIAALGVSLAIHARLRGLGGVMIAAVLGAVALNSYERFLLRPELITYICLVWVMILLQVRSRRPIAAMVALAGLQIVWTNCHGYFLLGPVVVGLGLAGRAGQWLWLAVAGRSERRVAADLRWLAVAALVMVGCCFANPRFAAGAVFPLRTLGRLYGEGLLIGGRGQGWSMIGEFGWPLTEAKIPLLVQHLYRLSLVVGVVAAVVQAVRRRWMDVAVVGLMLAASLAMRRNIALWALVAWPVVGEAAEAGLGRLQRRGAAGRCLAVGRILASVAVPAAMILLSVDVLTSRFYVRERREVRSGLGLSALAYPAGAVEFINAHRPAGRLYCPFEVGSYLLFFSRPPRPVLVHSNTFAYPADFFERAYRSQSDLALFSKLADEYAINTVVLKHTYGTAHRLIAALARAASWRLVFFDHNSVVFVRNISDHSRLIGRYELEPAAVRIERLAAAAGRIDRQSPGWAMVFFGNLFSTLGWSDLAMRAYRHAVQRQPQLYEAWNQMGVLYGRKAARAAAGGKLWLRRQYELKALRCFEKALQYNRGYRYAQENLRIARAKLGR